MGRARSAGERRTPRINRPSVLTLEGRALLSGSPRIDTFAVPTITAEPGLIVDGPDGDLWFTEDSGKIGRVTTQGQVTEFPLPTPANGSTPDLTSLTAGPDGAIWALDGVNGQVDRITDDGQVEIFAIPGGSAFTNGSIVSGTDGNLWFSVTTPSSPGPSSGTDSTSNPGTIDRITPEGVVTEFSLPLGGGAATSLAAGPDGVWFTDPSASRVGEVAPSGHIVEYGGPPSTLNGRAYSLASNSIYLAVGPDGDAYYVAQARTGSYLVKVDPGGAMTTVAIPGLEASNLLPDPAGVDFSCLGRDGIEDFDRLAPDGTVTTIAMASSGIFVSSGFAFGPDGNLWYTQSLPGVIGRIDLASTPALEPRPTLIGAGPDPVAYTAGKAGTALLAAIGEETSLDLAGFRHSADVAGLSATVDWGDGSAPTACNLGPDPDADTIPGEDPFVDGQVSGAHMYASAGSYTVTVTIQGTGPDGTPMSTEVVETVSAVAPTPVPEPLLELDATTSIAFQGNVADFTTPTPHGASGADFTAMVDWGDGTAPTTGRVVGFPTNATFYPSPAPELVSLFQVSGWHTYASAGSFTVSVTLTDQFGHSSTASSMFQVAPGPLAVDPSPSVSASTVNSVDLGTLTDFRGAVAGRNYSVTVDWGDGTAPTAGNLGPTSPLLPIEPPTGPLVLQVDGFHAYATAGDYTIHYTVADNQGDSIEATTSTRVSSADLSVEFNTEIDGDLIPVTPLAFITAPLAGDSTSDFTATVDWGDGTAPTTGTVGPYTSGDSNPTADFFVVSGGHTYAAPGLYDVTVSVDGPDGSTAQTRSTVGVAPSSVDYGNRTAFLNFTPGEASKSVPLANFYSVDDNAVAANFRATVDWGDGSPGLPATIQPITSNQSGESEFSVLAGHDYAKAGAYTVTITAVGADGIPFVISNQATVLAAPATGGETQGNPPAGTSPVLPILDPTPTPIASPEPAPPSTIAPATTSTPAPTTTSTSTSTSTATPSPVLSPTFPPFVGPTFPTVFLPTFPIFLAEIAKPPMPVVPKPSRHAVHKPVAHHPNAKLVAHHPIAKSVAHHAAHKPIAHRAETTTTRAKPRPKAAQPVVAKPAHVAPPKKHPAGPPRPAKRHR